MEETIEARPGLLSRLTSYFRREEEEYEDLDAPAGASSLRVHSAHRYNVCVRRQIVAFQDAVAAADGLKRGDQQILNLTMANAELREKIKDFLCGVGYAAEGVWEELGDNVYLLAPATAFVDVAPPSPRVQAQKN